MSTFSVDYDVMILITGDPVPDAERSRGNFAEMIRRIVPSHSGLRFRDVDVRTMATEELKPEGAVIVTGSPASLTRLEPWMDSTAGVLRSWVQAGVPVLGICFGHQLLGHALGGSVQQNPRGREIGTVQLRVTEGDDPVVGPQSAYYANATHVDSIVELPSGARILAHTDLEPHAAVRFAPTAWGVQFHPEIDAHIMECYVRARADVLREEGLEPERVLQLIGEAPSAAATVARFLSWARQSRAPG